MLTIAIIGGHKRLDKQQGYWSHLTYFTESWVYNLTEKHRRLMHVNTSLPDSSFTQHTRDSINKYKLYKEGDNTNNFYLLIMVVVPISNIHPIVLAIVAIAFIIYSLLKQMKLTKDLPGSTTIQNY